MLVSGIDQIAWESLSHKYGPLNLNRIPHKTVPERGKEVRGQKPVAFRLPITRDSALSSVDCAPDRTDAFCQENGWHILLRFTMRNLLGGRTCFRRLSGNGYFAQSLRQTQIIILEIPQCIPLVIIFAFLDLERTVSFSDSLPGKIYQNVNISFLFLRTDLTPTNFCRRDMMLTCDNISKLSEVNPKRLLGKSGVKTGVMKHRHEGGVREICAKS